jgi:hypothetical protein
MKQRFVILLMLVFLPINDYSIFAQAQSREITIASEAAEGLDLVAFGELFKGSENLQAFERAVNNPETGINNLDLDENGEVDFIRITEEVQDDTHLVIAQVPLGKDDVQDVATIEVEKESDSQYNFQIRGNETIYGVDYYIAPADIYVYRWPIVSLMYRPAYRPYRSTFHFGFYPPWHRPYRPVTVAVYRTRTVRLTGRTTFAITRTPRVRSVSKVRYTARNSTVVRRRTTVSHTRSGRTTVTRSTTVKPRGGRRRP